MLIWGVATFSLTDPLLVGSPTPAGVPGVPAGGPGEHELPVCPPLQANVNTCNTFGNIFNHTAIFSHHKGPFLYEVLPQTPATPRVVSISVSHPFFPITSTNADHRFRSPFMAAKNSQNGKKIRKSIKLYNSQIFQKIPKTQTRQKTRNL